MMLYETRIKRLVTWAKGGKAPPVTIELVPTDACNLNCLSCWRRGWSEEQLVQRYKQEMSDERILKLVDEAAEMGVKEIALVGGGEPLVRPVVIELMKKMKGYGMIGDLVTNGTLFTKEIIRLLVKIGWDRIKFSIDGPDAKCHDYLRQTPGAFKKAIAAIKNFSKFKREFKTDRPRLIIQSVLSKENYRQFPTLVKLAHRCGADEMLLLPLTVFDESMKSLKLGSKEMEEFKPILKECIELLQKFKIDSNYFEYFNEKYIEKTESMDEVMMEEMEQMIKREYPQFKNPVKNFLFLPCYAPWIHVTVLPNGNIAPCFSPWVWNSEVSLKTRSLKELWYGKYFEKFRKIILGRKLPENCKKCCVYEVFNNRKIRNGLMRFMEKGDISG